MAVRGYWQNAVAIPEGGKPAISYDWYRVFLTYLLENEHYTWIAPLVAWGEVLVGIALILGLLTGISAFFGALMNFSFMLAGTASTNPVLFFFSILLIQAWKIAGWYGLDRWLLLALGTLEPGEGVPGGAGGKQLASPLQPLETNHWSVRLGGRTGTEWVPFLPPVTPPATARP